MVSRIFANFVDTQFFCRMSSKNMKTGAGFQDDVTSGEICSYGLSLFETSFIVKHHSVYIFVSSLTD